MRPLRAARTRSNRPKRAQSPVLMSFVGGPRRAESLLGPGARTAVEVRTDQLADAMVYQAAGIDVNDNVKVAKIRGVCGCGIKWRRREGHLHLRTDAGCPW